MTGRERHSQTIAPHTVHFSVSTAPPYTPVPRDHSHSTDYSPHRTTPTLHCVPLYNLTTPTQTPHPPIPTPHPHTTTLITPHSLHSHSIPLYISTPHPHYSNSTSSPLPLHTLTHSPLFEKKLTMVSTSQLRYKFWYLVEQLRARLWILSRRLPQRSV